MSKFFYSPLPPTTIWCGNFSVVQTVNSIISCVRPAFPNDSLRPSWDNIQKNLLGFSRSSFFLSATCEGPSRSHYQFLESPLEAHLNIKADKLATVFQEKSSHGTDRGLMFPGSGCQLDMDNQIIPNNHRRRIRTRRAKEKLMNHIREKLQTSAEALSNIDWESPSQAIRLVPIPNRTFLMKFLHRWLPVGKL
jgi:hypothetical protein